MNQYLKNLNRIEFLITLACTGRCKHCSEGDHLNNSEFIDGNIAAENVMKVCEMYNIESIMTFGGEPLLDLDAVCQIHTAAKANMIPQRQLITNGFFSKNLVSIQNTAKKLAESGVNDILLSVDAFHQETIPLATVKIFAKEILNNRIPLRTHPAWLISNQADNPYNRKTLDILNKFSQIGIASSDGNIIFPSGNALKYLSEYFDTWQQPHNPYCDNPEDIHALCVSPNGDVLGGNIYQTDILEIINNYTPKLFNKV